MIPQSTLRSDAWLKVKAHLARELEIARERNDSRLGHDETTELRARIALIKELLALDSSTATNTEIGAHAPSYET